MENLVEALGARRTALWHFLDRRGKHESTRTAAPVLAAPVLVAVDRSPRAATVTAAAAKLATERGASVEVVHVHETDVLAADAVERESREMASAVLALRLEQLREAGVPAGGEVLHTFGGHEDAVAGRARSRRRGRRPAGRRRPRGPGLGSLHRAGRRRPRVVTAQESLLAGANEEAR